MVGGPRGRSGCREGCGQSSAATTSASVAPTPSGPAPRPFVAPASASARVGLAGQDEDPAHADPLRGRDVGAQVVADHRERRAREPLPEVRVQPGDRLAEDLRRRLAEDVRLDPGRELEPDDVRRRRRASRPSAVSHHGLRCIASSSAPPRTSRKATSMFRYDRSSPASPMTTAATVPGGAASASSAVSSVWPSNSRRASSAASTNSGRPGWRAAVWAAVAEVPVMIRSGSIGEAALARTSRRASRGGAARSSSRPGTGSRARRATRTASTAPGSGFALEDEHAVGIEDEAAHPAERLPEPLVRGHPPMVGCPATARVEERDGTARRQDGAHLRRRQRPLDRLGHRPGAPRRRRRGRLLVGREPDREAGAAAGDLDRLDLRRAVRRPVRRADPDASSRAGARPTTRSTSSSTRWRSRSARTSRASSSTPRATGSRWRSTSRPTRWSRSRARHARCSGAARRSSR